MIVGCHVSRGFDLWSSRRICSTHSTNCCSPIVLICFMCMGILSACLISGTHPPMTEDGNSYPRIGITDGYEPVCGC